MDSHRPMGIIFVDIEFADLKIRKEILMKTANIGHFMSTNQAGCIDDDVTCNQCGQLLKSGIGLIKEEQQRQKLEEVWPLESDEYTDGKLALVAACYAEFAILPSADRVVQAATKDRYWPWDEEWWKPKSPLHDLVHAGALIAAEIDRLLKVDPHISDQVAER